MTHFAPSGKATEPKPLEAVVAVMGPTGSGKSTFINLVSGSQLAVSRGLKSCTTHPQISQLFELDGCLVTLMDTPGFDDTTISDTNILKMIGVFLSTTYQAGLRLAGVIYMHRISDYRVGGISRKNFNMFRKLCGDDTLKNVLIVTNMWGSVPLELGIARERELMTDELLFKHAIDKGAKTVRHFNTVQSAHDVLRQLIRQPPAALRIQKELVDMGMDITETAAGVEIDRQLAALIAKHKNELDELRREMARSIAEKDLQTKGELDQVRQSLEEKIIQLVEDRDRISSEFAKERTIAAEGLREAMRALETEKSARTEIQRRIEISLEEWKQSTADMRRQIDQLRQQANRGLFTGLTHFIHTLFNLH